MKKVIDRTHEIERAASYFPTRSFTSRMTTLKETTMNSHVDEYLSAAVKAYVKTALSPMHFDDDQNAFVEAFLDDAMDACGPANAAQRAVCAKWAREDFDSYWGENPNAS